MQYISQIYRLVIQYWFWELLGLGLLLICIVIDAEIRQKRDQKLPGSDDHYRRCDSCGRRAHQGLNCGAS